MKQLGLVLVTMLGACGGGGDDDGGGGGVDAPTQGGGSCHVTPADTCGGDNICVSNTCVAAFPRVYRITDLHVTLGTTDPTGAAWDIGGGAPDPLVKISVNGSVVATTTTVQDSFTATFAGPFDVMLVGGTTLELDVFDEDVTVNDFGGGVMGTVTAALARGRGFTGQAVSVGITATLAPK